MSKIYIYLYKFLKKVARVSSYNDVKNPKTQKHPENTKFPLLILEKHFIKSYKCLLT